MLLRASTVAVILGLLAACSPQPEGEPTTIAPGEGADTPLAAVEELVDALSSGDFAEASHLAVPGQSALAALAEGAGFGEIAAALRSGDEEVAASFWAGFAQGAGSFLTGPLTVEEGDAVTQDGVDFRIVELTSQDGVTRSILIRELDGYRVDLFGSFGGGLADKMAAPAERLLTTRTDDARLILSGLRDAVPSLLAATALPETSAEISQLLTSLIEIITRVG